MKIFGKCTETKHFLLVICIGSNFKGDLTQYLDFLIIVFQFNIVTYINGNIVYLKKLTLTGFVIT